MALLLLHIVDHSPQLPSLERGPRSFPRFLQLLLGLGLVPEALLP